MKKTVLIVAGLVAGTSLSAQTGEITSNRGENWLSESGDWGLTIDANPFLNYAGNLFNGHTNNNIGSGYFFPNSLFAIQGKKLIDSNTAYRGMIRLGFGSAKSTVMTADLVSTDANAMVEDVQKIGGSNIVIGVGLEKRIGSTRIVGVYGGMFNISVGGSKTSYEYGNSVTDLNPVNANQFDPSMDGTTEVKNGGTFGFGLAAFAGVEWFVAPKVSLSGEYTWGLALSSTGYGESTSEAWDFANNTVETTTTEGGTKLNNFGIDNGVTGANIGLNFYFQ